jgi:hypothetical protein
MKAIALRKSTKVLAALFISFLAFSPLAPGFSRHLTQQQSPATALKTFEGFYQFPNQVAYVQLIEREQTLVARQVWDNREYVLVRKADLHFESRDEEYQLEFLKDKSGKLTAARILNRIVLTKVNFDPTREMTLSANTLNRLEGKYQFQRDKNLFLEIRAKNNQLELKQLWDGKTIVFSPRSALDFFNADLSFPLHFHTEGNLVKQVTCFGKDVWDKIK